MLRLRVLTVEDWPLWRDIRLAALTEAPHAFKSTVEEWESAGEARWRARMELPGVYNIVAELDGSPVGMATGLPRDNGCHELHSVWVSPRARGHGVGDRLVTDVLAWARESGASTLRLAVLPGNEAAIALYRRHGFALTAELGSTLPDGVTQELIMAKSLQ